MGMIRPFLGGLVGGIIGMFIWIEVGYFTHYEVGWIAWGVGILVGLGVRYAAHMGEQEASTALGFLSAGMAICCILIAKYIVFTLFINYLNSQMTFNYNYDEAAVVKYADEIIKEKIKQGAKIDWPEGMTAEEALSKKDYPPQIWQEAEKKWAKLSPQEREQHKQNIQQDIQKTTDALKQALNPPFNSAFTFWDILWFALASITAFKVGIGTYGSD